MYCYMSSFDSKLHLYVSLLVTPELYLQELERDV